MSSQDRLENVLRDIHVMISKSEAYDTDRIIVSKQDIFGLIDRLNASVYEIMDEYEMTQQSRERALRENKREGDKIIWDASRQAEDIYAASVMYTEEALNHLNGIVEDANETISRLYKGFEHSMKQQQETIRENQLELKSQLQLLTDTEKYLKLIEERNREIEREKARRKGRKFVEKSSRPHTVIKPEIKINEAYFRKAGIPIEREEEQGKTDVMEPLADEGVIESTLKKGAGNAEPEAADEDYETYEDYEGAAEEGQQTEDGSFAVSASADIIDDSAAGDAWEGAGGGALTDFQRAETKKMIEDNIKVNLDSEYFRRQNEGFEADREPAHHERTSLLDKLMGKKKSY